MARTKKDLLKKKKIPLIKQIEKRSSKKKVKEIESAAPEVQKYIPTPVTTFNCALCDDPFGGLGIGKMANIIGDSSAGKTIIALSIMAEMTQLQEFDNYRLIYDDVENALEMNVSDLFGERLSDRLEPPAMDDDSWMPSDTVEDFLCNIEDALDDGRPFLYILDSLDALDAKQDQKKTKELKDAHKKGTEIKGSYGGSKPKTMSWILRTIKARLKKSNSALIIVSQTRDNMNAGMFESKKYRAGGKALKFYCTHEIWLAVVKTLKKEVRKQKRIIGHLVQAKITKNKLTGKVRESHPFPIYYDYGVDGITSDVRYLVENGEWKKKKQTIIAEQIKMEGTEDKIIRQIEDNHKIKTLSKIVGKVWSSIEDSLRLNRRKKYQ